MFMVVFILLPPISNLIESELNILLSGAVRFLVVLVILAGSFSVDHNHPSSTIADTHTSSGSHSTTQDYNVCYYDWKWYLTSHIDNDIAPSGYEYVVATLYLKNNSDQKITTNPNDWNLIADGLKYGYNSVTYDKYVGFQDIEIIKGGNIETKIAFLVKGNPTTVNLQYDGTWGMGPTFKQIDHY
jgi:hypothetical protein